MARILIFVALLAIVGCDKSPMSTGKSAQLASQTVKQTFVKGMSINDVRPIVKKQYPIHSEYDAEECRRSAEHTSDKFEPLDGPCIFGRIDVPKTWWGFETSVLFRLIFDFSGTLQVTETRSEHTFL